MKIFNLLFFLSLGFVNGIVVRQYSDDSCTILSRIQNVGEKNCYSFASTGSYLIKTCNCTMIEYNLYDSSLCFGNMIGTFYAQQNICLSTRQKISCYEEYSSSNCALPSFSLLLAFIISLF